MHNETLDLTRLFLALSDSTRLAIVRLIGGGELSVGQIVVELDESQPKISRHLAFLRSSGVVQTRRDGKNVYYHLDLENSAIRPVLNLLIGVDVSLVDTSPGQKPTKLDIYANADVYETLSNDLEIYLL